jgi:hypothetical protein
MVSFSALFFPRRPAAVPASRPAARPARASMQPLLQLHPVLEPPLWPQPQPLGAGALDTRIGAVWKTPSVAPGTDDRLVTLRHVAFQELAVRVERLAGPRGEARHATLELFFSGALDHAYVDGDTYRRLEAEAGLSRGRAGDAAIFLDTRRDCLVIDTGRCFESGRAVLAGPAVQSVVGLLRARAFGAYLQQRPHLLGAEGPSRELVACGVALQSVAGCITRAALDEPGLQFTPMARRLAGRAGVQQVARAWLTGALGPTQATVLAFVPLWRQWVQDHPAAASPDSVLPQAMAEAAA